MSAARWRRPAALLAALVVAALLTARSAPLTAAEPEAADQAASADRAHGEEGGGEEAEHAPSINVKSLGLQLLNFGVLLFILIKFGGSAVNRALVARHQQLKTDLAAAAEARATAEERLRKQEQRLQSLEQEIAAIRAGITQEAQSEKARLIAAAEERARRIREETSFLLDQQVRQAEADLKREVAEASIRIAQELVQRAMTGGDQQRLVDAFVSEVATGNGAGAAARREDGKSGPSGPAPAPRSQI